MKPHDLTDKIHDLWFCVSEVEFVRQRGFVRLRLYRRPTQRIGRLLFEGAASTGRLQEAGHVVLRGVQEMEIEESEGIDCYDIDAVEHHADLGEVVVKTGCPVRFRLTVSRFDAQWTPIETS